MNYKQIRQKFHICREDWAEIMGSHKDTVGRWERGGFSPPGPMQRIYAMLDHVDDEDAKHIDLKDNYYIQGPQWAFNYLMMETGQ